MLSSALKQVGQRVSRLDRSLIMLVVLLTSVFPVELFPNAPPPPKGIDGQYSGRQGQVVLVKVPVTEEAYREFMGACGADGPGRVLAPTTSDVRAWPPIVEVAPDDAGFYCAWRGDRLASAQEWNAASRARPDLGPAIGFRCSWDAQ